MPLTKAEFQEACEAICPYCRSSSALRFREGTKEWVHDISTKGTTGHSICWASGFRTSRFAAEAE